MEAFQSKIPPYTVGQDQIEPELDVVSLSTINKSRDLFISIDPPS